jgi:hypothetical protein
LIVSDHGGRAGFHGVQVFHTASRMASGQKAMF